MSAASPLVAVGCRRVSKPIRLSDFEYATPPPRKCNKQAAKSSPLKPKGRRSTRISKPTAKSIEIEAEEKEAERLPTSPTEDDRENRPSKRKIDDRKTTDETETKFERPPLMSVENPKRIKLTNSPPVVATPKRHTPKAIRRPIASTVASASSTGIDLNRYPVLCRLLDAPSALLFSCNISGNNGRFEVQRPPPPACAPICESPLVVTMPPTTFWLQWTPPPVLQLQQEVNNPHLSAEFFAQPSWMKFASCGWESAAACASTASETLVYTNL